PTSNGSFNDTSVLNLTPTNAPNEVFTWFLQGSTSAATPAILSFAAVPSTIAPGQQATLSWTTSGATSVTIDNGVTLPAGGLSPSGAAFVSPTVTTTYTLTATNN